MKVETDSKQLPSYEQPPLIEVVKLPTALSSESCSIDSAEDNDDELDCRGVFVVSHQPKILFSEEVNIKSQETPTWKPCVVIDNYRLEDDN
ncbi:hypothetical protein MTo_04006 [Microcystis aeruginosa NIES-1211]|uniref:Uncharacterized protein n=1 Tax=Microcystis aeruginosa NIES-2519 TaxID=2303981 RepID=A0A5A5R9V5_MICAE|nr:MULTISPECIES: hypothetical protein [Microcystis]CCI30654.1 hypothetical protein MICAI_1310009 [Microcystis sp. T1-4]GBL16682.1 hypothetical protein MTo_04006 [Microcystis aeruginosa NIES-1211]GCA71828.1 hypothetical protein MiYa_03370 [Microcystis aeruginosa NIES-2519]AVQ73153.1 hypothetical protein B5D77_19135 [Microcystis sp. MC19]GCA82907.1 hypothetical protein MiHa_00864 [Microcystis aeruginosa NIES-2522]